jgi:adenylate cyclase, class 2
MKKEIEATFLSVDKDSVRAKLKETRFELKTPEYLMRRKTFDFPRVVPGRNKWGRVRQESDKITMTVKEVRGSGINDTYEVELIVNDFDTATSFFEACDILAKAFQENMREVWVRDGVEITIDTWPGLNPFVEIEGANEKIVREISNELDFDFEKAVFGSIDLVYEKELGVPAETIIRLPEITFANPPKKNAA